MTFDLAILSSNDARLITDLPVTFTWNGKTYQGARDTPDFTESLIIGGTDFIISYRLYVRASQFTAGIPAIGDEIIMDSVKHRVLGIRKSPDAANWLTFTLGFARKT